MVAHTEENLALATVEAHCAAPGTVLEIEVTVEWERKTVPAVVVPLPFFDPAAKEGVSDELRCHHHWGWAQRIGVCGLSCSGRTEGRRP